MNIIEIFGVSPFQVKTPKNPIKNHKKWCKSHQKITKKSPKNHEKIMKKTMKKLAMFKGMLPTEGWPTDRRSIFWFRYKNIISLSIFPTIYNTIQKKWTKRKTWKFIKKTNEKTWQNDGSCPIFQNYIFIRNSIGLYKIPLDV